VGSIELEKKLRVQHPRAGPGRASESRCCPVLHVRSGQSVRAADFHSPIICVYHWPSSAPHMVSPKSGNNDHVSIMDMLLSLSSLHDDQSLPPPADTIAGGDTRGCCCCMPSVLDTSDDDAAVVQDSSTSLWSCWDGDDEWMRSRRRGIQR
jgi:hypothetical protein